MTIISSVTAHIIRTTLALIVRAEGAVNSIWRERQNWWVRMGNLILKNQILMHQCWVRKALVGINKAKGLQPYFLFSNLSLNTQMIKKSEMIASSSLNAFLRETYRMFLLRIVQPANTSCKLKTIVRMATHSNWLLRATRKIPKEAYKATQNQRPLTNQVCFTSSTIRAQMRSDLV